MTFCVSCALPDIETLKLNINFIPKKFLQKEETLSNMNKNVRKDINLNNHPNMTLFLVLLF